MSFSNYSTDNMDIKTLKAILDSDAARFEKKPTFKDWILRNEGWFIYHYIRHLRYVEFYKDKGIKYKLLFYIIFLDTNVLEADCESQYIRGRQVAG